MTQTTAISAYKPTARPVTGNNAPYISHTSSANVRRPPLVKTIPTMNIPAQPSYKRGNRRKKPLNICLLRLLLEEGCFGTLRICLYLDFQLVGNTRKQLDFLPVGGTASQIRL